MIKRYDKLVRDRIPEIIEKDGHTPIFNRLTGAAFEAKLFEKLLEEQQELEKDRNIEEVTDVIEVLFSIARLYGFNEVQTLELLHKKRASKGGFEEGYLLEEVHLNK
jgi:predicted house-cleaning noncanonical NTP pyrophosphatase (MazG superfamily)